MVSNKNILIAQGGGPTNVINQSLVGIIQQEKNYKSEILGSINGVNGIINSRFISFKDEVPQSKVIISSHPLFFKYSIIFLLGPYPSSILSGM